MRAYRKRPGERPEAIEIPKTLKALQREVGGYIEPFRPPYLDGAIIVNEEGKIRGLPFNFIVWGPVGVDRIVGTAVFVGVDRDEFTDAPYTLEELETWLRSNDIT